MIYKTIGPIIDHIDEGYTDLKAQALDYLHYFYFSESEVVEQSIKYADYIATYKGISLYYDYGANYYFFVQEERYEVGDIIRLCDGRKVIVEIAQSRCKGCIGQDSIPMCSKFFNTCIPSCRRDNKNVIFKLVEE